MKREKIESLGLVNRPDRGLVLVWWPVPEDDSLISQIKKEMLVEEIMQLKDWEEATIALLYGYEILCVGSVIQSTMFPRDYYSARIWAIKPNKNQARPFVAGVDE